MGLDMAIRRVSKPRLEEGMVYDFEELDGICLRDEFKKNPAYCQVLPYTLPAEVRTEYCDLKKIIEDYGLASNSYISMYSTAGIRVSEPYSQKKVDISWEDAGSMYTYATVETCYICDCEDVRNWRKAYDIQDWFHEHLECEIENTGMYLLSDDVIKAFNGAFPEFAISSEEIDPEKPLFYWEWY